MTFGEFDGVSLCRNSIPLRYKCWKADLQKKVTPNADTMNLIEMASKMKGLIFNFFKGFEVLSKSILLWMMMIKHSKDSFQGLRRFLASVDSPHLIQDDASLEEHHIFKFKEKLNFLTYGAICVYLAIKVYTLRHSKGLYNTCAHREKE